MDLEGIRVLDLTRLLPGAFCSLLLADMGADVIKVEEPGSGDYMRWFPPLIDGQAAVFNAINRNKRAITLNLKTERGRELFELLAGSADVVVEGNRPRVMERLGLGWRRLHELNSRLVLCSITGYGQDGPFAQRAGHDLNYMATTGALSLNSPRGGDPHPLAVQVADIGAGGVGAAAAILGALVGVLRGGEGRHLDVAMADGAATWLGPAFAESAAGGQAAHGGRTRLTGRYPCYRVYRCKDGGYYSIGALEPKFWAELCSAMGRPDLLPFHVDESQAAHSAMENAFVERTRDEWQSLFGDRDVCAEPVLEVEEVSGHPQNAARGLIDVTASGLQVRPAVPPPNGWRRLPPPRLGEHNAEVFGGIGIDAAELEQLAAAGVV